MCHQTRQEIAAAPTVKYAESRRLSRGIAMPRALTITRQFLQEAHLKSFSVAERPLVVKASNRWQRDQSGQAASRENPSLFDEASVTGVTRPTCIPAQICIRLPRR